MPPQSDPPSDRPESAAAPGYWVAARRPLQILLFLLPLIVAYELCLALLLPGEDHVNTVEAHKSLLRFFGAFGIEAKGGLYLGGLVIVAVLLAWHLLARERWRVEPRVAAFMGVEALLLTVPLLVLSHVVSGLPPVMAPATPAPGGFAALDTWSQMAISVGAGLYEELLFRMVLIALLHTLLVDVAKLPHWLGAILAIAVSAAAFTAYHDLRAPDDTLSVRKVVFYFVAGLYLGGVYVARGFGIVVGVHAVYDVITVLLPDPTPDA